jgi:hypothetical protein
MSFFAKSLTEWKIARLVLTLFFAIELAYQK